MPDPFLASPLSPKRIYIATRWDLGPTHAQDVAAVLEEHHGFAVTHRWWTEQAYDSVGGWAANADRDLRGVAAADVVLILAFRGREGMGMWVEMGYAMGLGKPVLLWVPPEHAAFLQPSLSEATSPFVFAPGVSRWCCPLDELLGGPLGDAPGTRLSLLLRNLATRSVA